MSTSKKTDEEVKPRGSKKRVIEDSDDDENRIDLFAEKGDPTATVSVATNPPVVNEEDVSEEPDDDEDEEPVIDEGNAGGVEPPVEEEVGTDVKNHLLISDDAVAVITEIDELPHVISKSHVNEEPPVEATSIQVRPGAPRYEPPVEDHEHNSPERAS